MKTKQPLELKVVSDNSAKLFIVNQYLFKDLREVVKEASRVLVPGGYLFMLAYNRRLDTAFTVSRIEPGFNFYWVYYYLSKGVFDCISPTSNDDGEGIEVVSSMNAVVVYQKGELEKRSKLTQGIVDGSNITAFYAYLIERFVKYGGLVVNVTENKKVSLALEKNFNNYASFDRKGVAHEIHNTNGRN